eukprot:SAG22_NODE_694_length_7847_cov_4.425787_3_plen_71_part_00
MLACSTLELRDDGQFGFLLPDDQIIPNAEEIQPAMYEYGLAVLQAFAGAEARHAAAVATAVKNETNTTSS